MAFSIQPIIWSTHMPYSSNRDPFNEKPVDALQEYHRKPTGCTMLSATAPFTVTIVRSEYMFGVAGDQSCGATVGVVMSKFVEETAGTDCVLVAVVTLAPAALRSVMVTVALFAAAVAVATTVLARTAALEVEPEVVIR